MKFQFPCWACYDKAVPIDLKERKLYPVQILESNQYTLTCDLGHTTTHVVMDSKYALLAESAGYALVDGYPRESVATFAACQERFNEHCMRVLAESNEIEKIAFDQTWKHTKVTERQLGAFNMAFLLEFRKPAPQFPEKLITFRNDVIHKGTFPSENDALVYGQAVLDHVTNLRAFWEDKHRLAEARVEYDRQLKLSPNGAAPNVIHYSTTILNAYQRPNMTTKLKKWVENRRNKIEVDTVDLWTMDAGREEPVTRILSTDSEDEHEQNSDPQKT